MPPADPAEYAPPPLGPSAASDARSHGLPAVSDEFEEDTLLPPPAPGLVAPGRARAAEHVVVDTEPNAPLPVLDSLTRPGMGPTPVPPVVSSPPPPLHDAPRPAPPPSAARAIARVAEHVQPPGPPRSGSVPRVQDRTPERLNERVPERINDRPLPPASSASPLPGQVPILALEPSDSHSSSRQSARLTAAQPATSYQTAESPARRATTIPPLPELPAGPHGESGAALVAYMLRYRRVARRRRHLVQQAEQSLRKETPSLDRLLVELGQHAYIERMDPWGLLTGQAVDAGLSGPVPRIGPEGESLRRAESWVARIEAEQLRALAILSREEARLSSELMGRAEHQRRLRWHIESLPLQATYDQQAELTALRGESELLLQQLAAVRCERWMKEHALSRCQQQRAGLILTIDSLLSPPVEGATRSTPNLLLLGALLLGQRLFSLQPPEGQAPPVRSGRPAAMAPQLAVARFQERLSQRAMLSSQGLVEQLAYDRDAVRRGVIFLGVFSLTGLVCALIAWWALSNG